MAPTAGSCGRRTAPRAAPSWSRTSTAAGETSPRLGTHLTSGADVTEPGPRATTSAGGQGMTEVRYQYSPQLPNVLADAGCSLLVSTYQAGQLVALGVADGELSFSFRGFDRAMGVAVGADRVAVAGK